MATDHDRIVAELLDTHGRTFASEAGIRVERDEPSQLFRLLCLSMLVSARIRADLAMGATRALADHGWTTAEKMAEASWEERTRVLNESGYARYDESTSRYLGDTARLLVDRYGGDLRRAREAADGDRDALRERLKECKGIGDVGASVFMREVQVAWDELDPFLDDHAARNAAQLGLPTEPEMLRALVDDTATFTRLVAALVRTGLDDAHDEILEGASAR